MHTNQLIHETSPYLLQHAHNPVNWFPWGPEALQKAIDEDKPILVSIGYAACHWCHVMERESFEEEQTAALMNEHFINIKIDREERPDLDQIYMDAVQSMTSSGGWPLNVFLTPEGKPFYGGTYFPPIAAYNKPSWKDILTRISKAYREQRKDVFSQAEKLTEHLVYANSFGIEKQSQKQELATTLFTKESCDTIAQNILKQSDESWGGFGKAPKFPQTYCIQYLLRHYHFTKDQNALEQALLSVDKMIGGGIYDQVGGGFSRYSTDNKWLAPHFEKMLYDNALLMGVLSEAYQLTEKKVYAEAIQQSMAFIVREMLQAEGGFYSALDADSEGVEGKFYTWSKKEIEECLGHDANLFYEYYGVTELGNWEGTNILWVQKNAEAFTTEKGIDLLEFKEQISKWNSQLLAVRSTRVRPQLDDKLLLSWNALMNVACCKAYAALADDSYKELAIRNMKFLETKMRQLDGSWHHTYKEQQSKISAFLDDYAYLIQAYIHLQEITGNTDYLIKAKEITRYVIKNFSEEETGYFYFTNQAQTDVILRKKEVYDGATPSGNAVMALNLLILSIIFDQPEWGIRAKKIVLSLGRVILSYPTSFGVWASILQLVVEGVNEVVVAGKDAFTYLPEIVRRYLPNKILQTTQTNQSSFPLLNGKFKEANAAFFLCKNYACEAAFFDLNTFFAKL